MVSDWHWTPIGNVRWSAPSAARSAPCALVRGFSEGRRCANVPASAEVPKIAWTAVKGLELRPAQDGSLTGLLDDLCGCDFLMTTVMDFGHHESPSSNKVPALSCYSSNGLHVLTPCITYRCHLFCYINNTPHTLPLSCTLSPCLIIVYNTM